MADRKDKSSPQRPSTPHPSRLSAPGVRFFLRSSSTPVNGHCSVEKEMFSVWRHCCGLSPWAKAWEASLSRAAAGKQRWHLAWMRGQWTLCACDGQLGQPSVPERPVLQDEAMPTAQRRLWPPNPPRPAPNPHPTPPRPHPAPQLLQLRLLSSVDSSLWQIEKLPLSGPQFPHL